VIGTVQPGGRLLARGATALTPVHNPLQEHEMRKLELDVGALEIESFATGPAERADAGGTVHAHQPTLGFTCGCPGTLEICVTDDVTCLTNNLSCRVTCRTCG
jgi:hypothetical protein